MTTSGPWNEGSSSEEKQKQSLPSTTTMDEGSSSGDAEAVAAIDDGEANIYPFVADGAALSAPVRVSLPQIVLLVAGTEEIKPLPKRQKFILRLDYHLLSLPCPPPRCPSPRTPAVPRHVNTCAGSCKRGTACQCASTRKGGLGFSLGRWRRRKILTL